MKKILTFCFIVTTLTAFSQHIVDKEVGDFNEIKVFDLIEVNLIQSDENRIKIKGEHAYDIKFVNKDGVLKLRMQLERKFSGEDTLIEVFYTNLDVVDSNEGARIIFNETVEKDRIELKAQEGGLIRIGMDVQHVDVRAVTGGIVEASGLAKNQVIVLNTGGIFEGRELKTKIASVKVTAGGEAQIHASDKLDINVKAGGDVSVYGNPKDVSKKTMAGGRIVFRD